MVGTAWQDKEDLPSEIRDVIVDSYGRTGSPITTRTIMTETGEPSWHTIQRYLKKLEEQKLIKRIDAPNNQITWVPINLEKLKKADLDPKKEKK